MDTRLVLALLFTTLSLATVASANEAYIRVIDAGGGLCVVARTPAGSTFVYDAGSRTAPCIDSVRELAPERTIDLLAIDRIDARKLDDLPEILAEFQVREIVYNSDEVSSLIAQTSAVARQVGAEDLPFGHSFDLGDARVVYVAGWQDGADTRGRGEPRRSRNFERAAATIMVQFQYGPHSVLMAGASVGSPQRRPRSCRYGERIMVENSSHVPIDSDAIVFGAAHMSACFIEAVSPAFVVAGHIGSEFEDRLVTAGVTRANMFSTTFDECPQLGSALDDSYIPCRERARDDDVELWLPHDGPLRAAYRRPRFVRDAVRSSQGSGSSEQPPPQ